MRSHQGPISVCIVSHNAYGAIGDGQNGFIGGVEWQTSFLARWLAARGHQVSFITWNDGGTAEEHIAGVRVITVCAKNSGARGLRFFYPRWTSLVAALRRANADLYYHNCAEAITGQIGLWCRWCNRPFIFSVASDADCERCLPQFSNVVERALYRAGLHRAALRITQTQRQRLMMQRSFGLDSVVVPMPCLEPVSLVVEPPDLDRVLWVGRVCPVKRPEWIIAVARLCPNLRFDFVGPTYGDAYSESVAQRASGLPNVTVHGAVARNQMPDFYRRAGLLCCTSEYEGFPNTFLEAWSHGLPVVATVNPDDLLTNRRLGLTASTVEGLAAALQRLRRDNALRAELSANARSYFLSHHSAEIVLPRFEALFGQVVQRQGPPLPAMTASLLP